MIIRQQDIDRLSHRHGRGVEELHPVKRMRRYIHTQATAGKKNVLFALRKPSDG
jgi:hypothetical protein